MNEQTKSPTILVLVSDIYFSIAIEEACRKLQYFPLTIEPHNKDQYFGTEAEMDKNQGFLDYIHRNSPSLMIVDLNNTDLPWKEWISLVKSTPAAHDLPVLCFGPHVNTSLMETAREAGADEVIARSRFMSSMEELIVKYAKNVPDDPSV